jgi:hypothetical protein
MFIVNIDTLQPQMMFVFFFIALYLYVLVLVLLFSSPTAAARSGSHVCVHLVAERRAYQLFFYLRLGTFD